MLHDYEISELSIQLLIINGNEIVSIDTFKGWEPQIQVMLKA